MKRLLIAILLFPSLAFATPPQLIGATCQGCTLNNPPTAPSLAWTSGTLANSITINGDAGYGGTGSTHAVLTYDLTGKTSFVAVVKSAGGDPNSVSYPGAAGGGITGTFTNLSGEYDIVIGKTYPNDYHYPLCSTVYGGYGGHVSAVGQFPSGPYIIPGGGGGRDGGTGDAGCDGESYTAWATPGSGTSGGWGHNDGDLFGPAGQGRYAGVTTVTATDGGGSAGGVSGSVQITTTP